MPGVRQSLELDAEVDEDDDEEQRGDDPPGYAPVRADFPLQHEFDV